MKDTAIGMVIDKSGSMGGQETQTVQHFNEFLQEQKSLGGRATLTRVLFNHEYPPDVIHTDLVDADEMTEEEYICNGRTALLDAVGYTIKTIEEKIADIPEDERPEQAIVCIITDGLENASSEYTNDEIEELIDEKESEGWEFIYIGAGVNEFDDAQTVTGQNTSKKAKLAPRQVQKQCKRASRAGAQQVGATRSSGDGSHSAQSMGEHYKDVSTAVSNYRQDADVGDWQSEPNDIDDLDD